MMQRIVSIGCMMAISLPAFTQTNWAKSTEELIVNNAPFAQCHATTIVEPVKGKLLAAWFGGAHEGAKDVQIWASEQISGKWSEPKAVANGIINDTLRYPCWNPVLFKDNKGILHLYYKAGPNPREWWGMEITSPNNGKTWSAPARLRNGILGPIKNKPVQLSDGVILSPSSTETTSAWRAHIERSADGGKTWQYIPIDTAGNNEVIQPSILQYSDGRLQVLCRSKSGRVMQAWSTNKGRTWGPLTPTTLLNPNAGTDAVTLKSGWQLIVYNPDLPREVWSEGRTKLHVAASKDGTNWTDIAVLENAQKGEFSYPAIIQTQDGKVHITYTYDRKNVKHVVLEAQPEAGYERKEYSLIPFPTSFSRGEGDVFLTITSSIAASTEFAVATTALQQLVKQALGRPLPPAVNTAAATVVLKKDTAIKAAEGYTISITNKKVTLAASTPAGMFRAVETIRQLLPVSIESRSGNMQRKKPEHRSCMLPVVSIIDEPAYAWRGLHLDVARHFFGVDYIEKLLDRMALYKMNKLHLHLTDDQGWRIEIKRYPALTEKGAWRTFDANDSFCMKQAVNNPDMAIEPKHIKQRDGKTVYGGFYTQEQIKHLVQYAADRYIDIIPEIDMPGHMMAAIHQYPELSCEGGSQWGELFSTPICPCNENTYTFAENVFSEVMALFPSEYIHLGADEVDRKSWDKSAACQELMKKEGLKNSAELQSYFVRRMEKFFQSKGRKLIGWDEILEGGISPTANVMYWRSWVPDAPIHAAQNGNHVIMSPGNPLYFDNLPDANSLSNIYHFHVVPEKLDARSASFIIGAQANLWAERVPSDKRADYLYFPRMLALAERVWSKQLNYPSFQQRVTGHYIRLEALGVNYRLPDLSGFTAENVFVDKAVLDVQKPLSYLKLRYTTDGSLPQVTSTEMTAPLSITTPQTIKLAAFTEGGTRGEIYTLNYKQEAYQQPVTTASTQPGLQVNYYKKYYKNTAGMKGQPDSQYVAPAIVVAPTITAPSFGLQYSGYINVPETAVYSFFLLADDGAILNIGGKLVIDNDGQHGPVEKSGQVALTKGMHPFKLHFIEAGGGFSLGLKYSIGNGPVNTVPAQLFVH